MPPFTGVGVKVTVVPAQMLVADAATVTEGVTVELTVIVMALEVADIGEAQAKDVVTTQVTTSPFERPELVYVDPPVPTLLPFNRH